LTQEPDGFGGHDGLDGLAAGRFGQLPRGLGQPAPIGGHHHELLALPLPQHAVDRIAGRLPGSCIRRLVAQVAKDVGPDGEIRLSLELRDGWEVLGVLAEDLVLLVLSPDHAGLVGRLDCKGILGRLADELGEPVSRQESLAGLGDLNLADDGAGRDLQVRSFDAQPVLVTRQAHGLEDFLGAAC
jgi:hypothetical protein